MALSEDFKKFINKALPDFKVTDDTTEADIDTAFGDAFILTTLHEAEKDKLKVQSILKHETSLKKIIGDSAKGKTIEEMIATILPEFIKQKEDKIADLETELKGTGKTTEDYEKIKNELAQVKADLNQANLDKTALTEERDAALNSSDEKLNQHLFKEAIDKIYYTGVEFPEGKGWADDVDIYRKKGIWAEKIEGKVIPKKDEDGNIYAYEPDGQTYIKDGTGKKKFSKFVEEVLKSDDVKAWKENGTTHRQHNDNSTPKPPVDKKEAHNQKMQEIIDAQK